MSRTFRGKARHNGKWVYGYHVQLREHHYIINPEHSGSTDGFRVWTEVLAESVSMCSGLKDPSGADIYEKDIAMVGGTTICVVSWDESEPGFVLMTKDGGKAHPLNVEWAQNIEVWGNIIDVPDVLAS